jgi:hypothetical protein
LKESRIEESINISFSKRSISNDEGEEIISLENIPQSIKPFFNYGS